MEPTLFSLLILDDSFPSGPVNNNNNTTGERPH